MLQVGVAGWGWAAMNVHHPGIRALPAQIVAICDPAPAQAPPPGVPLVDSLAELRRHGAEMLLVSTPNDLHLSMAEAGLRLGMHVLCEKPLALSAEPACDLVQLARSVDRRVLVSAPTRFRNDVGAWLRRVDALGPLRLVELRWLRRNGAPRPGSWFTSVRRAGGGALADLGSHLLDLLARVVQGRALDVAEASFERDPDPNGSTWFGKAEGGEFDVETSARVRLVGDGLEAVVEVAWRAPVDDDRVSLRAVAERGAVELVTVLGHSPARLRCRPLLHVVDRAEPHRQELAIEDLESVYARAWRAYEESIRGGVQPDFVTIARWLGSAYACCRTLL